MNLVHSLTPSVGVDQSLMPPPPMQDTAADESTNKKPKYKGIKMSLRIKQISIYPYSAYKSGIFFQIPL